jgi:hypothetical protein
MLKRYIKQPGDSDWSIEAGIVMASAHATVGTPAPHPVAPGVVRYCGNMHTSYADSFEKRLARCIEVGAYLPQSAMFAW